MEAVIELDVPDKSFYVRLVAVEFQVSHRVNGGDDIRVPCCGLCPGEISSVPFVTVFHRTSRVEGHGFADGCSVAEIGAKVK